MSVQGVPEQKFTSPEEPVEAKPESKQKPKRAQQPTVTTRRLLSYLRPFWKQMVLAMTLADASGCFPGMYRRNWAR
jgi:hypothetical protein